MVKFADISSAKIPEGPGHYAWYFVPHIPTGSDQKKQFLDAIDMLCKLSKKDIVKSPDYDFLKTVLFDRPMSPLLATHGLKFDTYDKSTVYTSGLSERIQPKYNMSLTRSFDNAAKLMLENGCANPKYIPAFYNHLDKMAPEFLSPIYVGKANDLSVRIRSHYGQIENVVRTKTFSKKDISPGQNDDEEIEREDEDMKMRGFGSQMAYYIGSKIANPRNLRVHYCEFKMEDYDITDKKSKNSLEFIEDIINRVVSPSKGRL